MGVALLGVTPSGQGWAGPQGPVVVEGQGWAQRHVVLREPAFKAEGCLHAVKDKVTAVQEARNEAEQKAKGEAIVACSTHPDGLDEGAILAGSPSQCQEGYGTTGDACGGIYKTYSCEAKIKMRCAPRRLQSSRGVQESVKAPLAAASPSLRSGPGSSSGAR